MKKLAIISTHPIQYYAPVFKLLHQRGQIEIKVFYTWGGKAAHKFDPGFNKVVAWDIPLLDGYPYEWVDNVSNDAGSHRFNGIINPDLINQIELWQPDSILVYGWAYNSHLKILRHFKKKIPIFFRGDSTLLNEKGGVKSWLKTIFLKWVYNHVDFSIYVGANNKAYFKKYGLKENQLVFAPHSIDNDRFKTERSDEVSELRSSLGLKEADILILFAGKFEFVKNVELLLSAFIQLNDSEIHLLLVGNGTKEDLLKAQAAKSDIAKNIHFLDFSNQSYMPVLYQASDLFCLPSLSETWGLAINEAMVCGNAILASDRVGSAKDLVIPGYNGAIFSSGSLENLTKCLSELMKLGKAELTKMGQRSRKLIEDWSIEVQAKAIESIVTNPPQFR